MGLESPRSRHSQRHVQMPASLITLATLQVRPLFLQQAVGQAVGIAVVEDERDYGLHPGRA